MSVLPPFIFAVALPLITIILLGLRRRRPFPGWLGALLLAIGVTGFSVLVAPWGMFGVPMRYALMVLLVVAVIVSLRRPIPEQIAEESPFRAVVKILVAMLFGGVALSALQGRQVPPGAIDLAFPLRGGSFLVVHGGSTPATNIHHADAKQRYAVDIVKLNSFGMRAEILNADVLSPCDGAIVSASKQVVIRCGDVNVHLEHLRPDVRAGATVAKGQILGRVGESGGAIEPHLHIHAERNGVAVPARLSGEWWVRNEVARR